MTGRAPRRPPALLPVLGALGLALACAQDKPVRVSTAQSRQLGSARACLVGDGGLPALPEEDGEPVPPVRPAFQAGPLLAPGRPGESVAELAGCLAAADLGGDGGVLHPPRGAQAVRLNPLSAALIVTHELDHPCCLQARVSSAVEGAQVRVTELLSGDPCPCRCASTIRTAVGLAPGRYSVSVILQSPDGGQSVAHSGEVTLGP